MSETTFTGKLVRTPRDHFAYAVHGDVTYRAKGVRRKHDLTRCGATEREAMAAFVSGVLATAEDLEREVYAL